MFDPLGANPLVTTMDKAMGLATKRQGLIASNLANLDTPGYRTQDFDFQQALKAELDAQGGHSLPMARTSPAHFSGGGSSGPAVTHPNAPSYERNDGNDVNLDRETLLLARTQAAFQAASSFTQQEIRKIRQAITDSVAH